MKRAAFLIAAARSHRRPARSARLRLQLHHDRGCGKPGFDGFDTFGRLSGRGGVDRTTDRIWEVGATSPDLAFNVLSFRIASAVPVPGVGLPSSPVVFSLRSAAEGDAMGGGTPPHRRRARQRGRAPCAMGSLLTLSFNRGQAGQTCTSSNCTFRRRVLRSSPRSGRGR